MLRFDAHFGDLDREIDRYIDQMQRQKRPVVQFGHRVWRPLVDLFETEDMLVAVVELAGVDQDALDISVEDRTLAVRGRRILGSDRQPSSYHVMEISHGLFERVVPLPASVDPDKTSANVRNGMLEVCMPKAKRQRISITVVSIEPSDGR